MMDEVQRDVSDTLHKANFCRLLFYVAVLLLAGWFLAGPWLSALERNDYEKPKVVQI